MTAGKTARKGVIVKKQWQDFLDSKPCWSYNIVPIFVKNLETAKKSGNSADILDAISALNTQGITLHNGNLVYLHDIFDDLIDTMTVAETAEELGCSRANVYRLIKAGRLQTSDKGVTVQSVQEHKKNKVKPGRPFGSFKKGGGD